MICQNVVGVLSALAIRILPVIFPQKSKIKLIKMQKNLNVFYSLSVPSVVAADALCGEAQKPGAD